MATEYGFIYVIGNSCMPGIYKIGFTTNHPAVRIDQLSGATACPTPFEMYACFGVENPREAETEIHNALAKHRVNSNREFFKVTARHMLEIIDYFDHRFVDLINTSRLEQQARRELGQDRKAWLLNHFFEQEADPFDCPVDDIPNFSSQ